MVTISAPVSAIEMAAGEWRVPEGNASTMGGFQVDVEVLADAAEMLGRRALQFGEIERTACQHPSGRPETDATHTVMLAWLAPALAALFYPDLDVGLVTQFAVVHDAVEVYCGDTPTLRITAAEYAAKRERERVAADQWAAEFGRSLGWLPEMIRRYEAQEEAEARFVRAADKCCPALVHASNGARDLAGYGVTAAEQDARRAGHRAEMAAYAGEFTVLLDLRDVLAARLAATLRAREAGLDAGDLGPAGDQVPDRNEDDGHAGGADQP